jgi:predicted transcriptional regulator
MLVQELCQTNVRCSWLEMLLVEAATVLWDADCEMLPVVNDDGVVVGVVTDRDIAVAAGTRPVPLSQITVGEVMTRDPWTVKRSDDVRAALQIMTFRGVRRLPVVDDNRVLHGVITLQDIAQLARSPKHGPDDLAIQDVLLALIPLSRPASPAADPASDARKMIRADAVM